MKTKPDQSQLTTHFNIPINMFPQIQKGKVKTECFGYVRYDLNIFIVTCDLEFTRKNYKYNSKEGYKVSKIKVYADLEDYFQHHDLQWLMKQNTIWSNKECYGYDPKEMIPFIKQRIKEGDWFNDLIRPYLDPYLPTKENEL
jgi:hypothetical protein